MNFSSLPIHAACLFHVTLFLFAIGITMFRTNPAKGVAVLELFHVNLSNVILPGQSARRNACATIRILLFLAS